jgi:23S rRNA U2552 (ribose-2'-O)-methylase RlmE/FtsJ
MDITVKSLTGNIECQEHGFHIGNASLSDPVSIASGETGTLTVVGSWTDEAVDHCRAEHVDEEMIDVVLVDLAVDFSGIQIQLDPSMMQQGMQIPNLALLQE